MVEWRDRGFVQDSDNDEDEDENIETQSPARSNDESPLGTWSRPSASNQQNGVLIQRNDLAGKQEEERGPSQGSDQIRELGLGHIESPGRDGNKEKVSPTTRSSTPMRIIQDLEEDDVDELQMDQLSPAYYKRRPEISKTPSEAAQEILSEDDGFKLISSPLSEPEPTPIFGSLPQSQRTSAHWNERMSQVEAAIDKSTRQHVEVQIIIPDAGPYVDEERRQAEIHRRMNLRERKNIQLNPYTVEASKYKQTMRAGGVQPVRVAVPSLPRRDHYSKEQDGVESQSIGNTQSSTVEQDQRHANTLQETTLRNSSPISLDSSPPEPFVLGDDEELPDITELFRRNRALGNKRRKITHQYSIRRSPRSVLSRGAYPPSAEANVLGFVPENMLDVPPSPPGSNSISPPPPQLRTGRRVRFPPSLSPERLPTPATSSSAKLRSERSIRVRIPEISPAPPRSKKQTVNVLSPIQTSIEPADTSSSESDTDPAIEIRAVKKQIKGVLPASWLKLDLQAREKSYKARQSSPKRTGFQNEDEQSHRGVAHRSIRKRPRHSSPMPTLSNDEEDEPSDINASLPNFGLLSEDKLLPPRTQNRLAQLPISLFDDDPGDLMEDNSVDHMFPTIARARKKTSTGRRRQTKLRDAFHHSAKRLKTGEATSYQAGPLAKTRRTSSPARISNRKPRAPKLSVLDVLDEDFETSSSVPQFLKIAARQARRHSDGARQSPTNKLIRLQTRQDTEEVTTVLQNWRSGSIRPREPKTRTISQSRLPLAERSNNLQLQEGSRPTGVHVVAGDKMAERKERRPQQTQLQPVVLQPVKRMLGSNRNHESKPKGPWTMPSKTAKPWHHAQLEVDEELLELSDKQSSFEHGLRLVNRDFELLHARPAFDGPRGSLVLNRRGNDERISDLESPSKARSAARQVKGLQHNKVLQKHTEHNPHRNRNRKRPTHRVDIDTREYRQPEEFVLPSSHQSGSIARPDSDQPALQDLSPFGVPYAKDFDISPFPLGTYFHESTFIGSGEFCRALSMEHRDLDVDVGRHVVNIEGRLWTWSQWNEELASSIRDIFQSAAAALPAMNLTVETNDTSDENRKALTSVATVIVKVIRANSDWLSFSDPIDRMLCTSRFLEYIQPLQTAIVEKLDVLGPGKAHLEIGALLVRVATLQVTLVRQLLAISKGYSTAVDDQLQAQDYLKSLCSTILRYLIHRGFDDIRTLYDQNSRHSSREAGIGEGHVTAEAILIILHVLKAQQVVGYSFWEAFNSATLSSISCTTQIGTLERAWYDVFTMLPLLEVDAIGVLRIGSRFTDPHDNWPAIKTLLSRVFTLYFATTNAAGNTVNDYVRALLTRCHHLIQAWGWRKCEPIIGVIFDFFARNSLAPLRNENTRGSPRFLEMLHQDTSLDVLPEDKSFHIFLKIVALGLRGLRGVYTDKVIRGIAWRCIPNHGRTYKKDQALKQEDLDALRNHHDLLCTLYWASPPGFRPRVDLVQNLVDHAASHREACRLNIKAWTNLAKYQLSTGEDSERLQAFASWFKDIAEQTMDQFRLARSEAEAQYEAARKDGNTFISVDVLNSTVARNQNQVLSSLTEAVASMKSVMDSGKNLLLASELLRGSGMEQTFSLFNPKNSRTNSVIIEALLAYRAYITIVDQTYRTSDTRGTSQQTSEESQDYGDWPGLEEEEEKEEKAFGNPKTTKPIATEFIFEPVAHLLSNCFGAEKSPDDTLLTAVVDIWTKLASLTVRQGQHAWDSFLDEHGSHAWSQLRETEQRRKYGPYFLSSVLKMDPSSFDNNRSHFLSAWLSALVERDSQLRFQHHLTTVILNQRQDDPLLHNLPFMRHVGSEEHEVSITELRERRLSLLSSILSNMRDHFDGNPHLQNDLRREYVLYLKQLMAAMRANYTALQQGEHVTGAYVNFVQQVVEFLQQYTFDIYPIDRFFTDSSMFPLPAKDRTYVVGKLKGYGAKLTDPKAVKQLAGFFHNVSERAAVDNEQQYLIEQLQTALIGTLEIGETRGPSLKALLIQAIFPAYIESSFTTQAGWIMAKPVLVACARILDHLFYDFCATDILSVDVSLTISESILAVLQRAVGDLGDRMELFRQPHALCTLSAILDAVTAITPCIDYILRRTGRGEAAARSIMYFKSFSIFAAKTLLGVQDTVSPALKGDESRPGIDYVDVRQFCARELHRDLQNWKVEGGQYFVRRGSIWKEVTVEMGSLDEERERLVHSIEEFLTVLARMRVLDGSL